MIARQRSPLIALAEFLEADGAFSFVLQNFALGVVDRARCSLSFYFNTINTGGG